MELKGKVAIVTGAGRGLGRASAIALARAGADLVIVSRTPGELEQTAVEIMAGGGTVVVLEGDVGRAEDVRRVVDTAVETFGGVDILMNNAAVIGAIKPLHEVSQAEWEAAVAVNLTAPQLFARLAVPSMIRQGGGKIINVTTGLAEFVLSPFGAYSVTKAGLLHLTRIMSAELERHHIQVNGLDPGVMDTRMQEDIRQQGPTVLGKAVYEDFVALKERGELLPPAQVARLALFLASPRSGRVTGENGTERHYRQFGYRAAEEG